MKDELKNWLSENYDNTTTFSYHGIFTQVTGDARLGILLSFIADEGFYHEQINGGLSEDYDDGIAGMPFVDSKYAFDALVELGLLLRKDPDDAPENLNGGFWLINENKLINLILKKPNYQEYLKSRSWHCRRIIALMRADYRCQLCNKTKELHVHHRTYESLGHEPISDLVVLCKDCHAKFHDKVNT